MNPAPANASTTFDNVVQSEDLIASANPDRLFIDVRLGEPEEELTSFRTCHVFGAVHAQIRDVFAAPPTPVTGNLPLPDIDALQKTLSNWGVNAGTEVVVYGPTPALAARGWWVLKWAGVPKVRLLDGGLNAWIAAGGPVAQGDARPRPSATNPIQLKPAHMPQITVEDVEQLGSSTILIDARDEPSFLAGHIPDAKHLPAADQWMPSKRLRPVREIVAAYANAGVGPESDVVVYCGGGVLSALEVLTLSATGCKPRLYVGSWSEWNKSPTRLARSAG